MELWGPFHFMVAFGQVKNPLISQNGLELTQNRCVMKWSNAQS